jgi:hypothetical protein
MCPYYGFKKWCFLQTFYEGLTNNTRMTIDAAVVGSLMNRKIGDAYNLIKEMALNQVQWSTERGPTRAQVSGKFEIDQINKLQPSDQDREPSKHEARFNKCLIC